MNNEILYLVLILGLLWGLYFVSQLKTKNPLTKKIAYATVALLFPLFATMIQSDAEFFSTAKALLGVIGMLWGIYFTINSKLEKTEKGLTIASIALLFAWIQTLGSGDFTNNITLIYIIVTLGVFGLISKTKLSIAAKFAIGAVTVFAFEAVTVLTIGSKSLGQHYTEAFTKFTNKDNINSLLNLYNLVILGSVFTTLFVMKKSNKNTFFKVAVALSVAIIISAAIHMF